MTSKFNNKSLLIFVAAHPSSVVSFLLPHLIKLFPFYSLRVLVNSKEHNILINRGLRIDVNYVRIERIIKPLSDLIGLISLILEFIKFRPSVVHSITPKAGLLAMTAAYLTRVPLRVHTFTGQVWVTRRGPMRWLLKTADKLTAAFATDVLVDSPSQQHFLIEEGVVTANRSLVLGAGSICGVNSQRFCPNWGVKAAVRNELGSPLDALVCLYLGRLNQDKGVLDLALAFAKVAGKYPKAELWIVGPDEADWFEQMTSLLGSAMGQVKRVGFTPAPERYMQAADLFCLPSYREGFGSSVIEAAACGVPALASRIYGLTDAVVEGQTGWLHEAGNVLDLTAKIDDLLDNPNELVIKGQAARVYAASVFDEKMITSAMLQFYKKRVNETSV